MMKTDIKLDSRKKQFGQWIPSLQFFIHQGNETRHLGWKWKKTFDTKEKADRFAVLGAKHLLTKQGYQVNN